MLSRNSLAFNGAVSLGALDLLSVLIHAPAGGAKPAERALLVLEEAVFVAFEHLLPPQEVHQNSQTSSKHISKNGNLSKHCFVLIEVGKDAGDV